MGKSVATCMRAPSPQHRPGRTVLPLGDDPQRLPTRAGAGAAAGGANAFRLAAVLEMRARHRAVLGTIFLVLGTIFMGIATPTEAGAMGAVGALLLAAMYRTLTWKLTYQAMSSTMRITAMVAFILIGARVFSLVFQGVGGGKWIEHMLTGLPGGQIGFLTFSMVFVFFIAFFLDFFEIAFIIIPLLTPAAEKLDINLIWFGLLICANIQTSFMHPPFGFALFYLRGIATAGGEEPRHLSRLDPLDRAAVDPRGADDRLPADGDLLARQATRHRPGGAAEAVRRDPLVRTDRHPGTDTA